MSKLVGAANVREETKSISADSSSEVVCTARRNTREGMIESGGGKHAISAARFTVASFAFAPGLAFFWSTVARRDAVRCGTHSTKADVTPYPLVQTANL